MNALSLGEQQRADALSQRTEDQRVRADEKSEAESSAKTAFVRRIALWTTPKQQQPDGWNYIVRNSNTAPATIYARWNPADENQKTLTYELPVGPCTEVAFTIGGKGGGSIQIATQNPAGPELWQLAGAPLKIDDITADNVSGRMLDGDSVRRDVNACV
ncbi:hypothetical protein [Nonomuraea sp. NPDC001699]